MKRKIIKIMQGLFANQTFTIRHGLAKGFKRRFGYGFKPKFRETNEETFLRTIDFNHRVVYDVGGYIGLYSMFFSKRAKSVFVFEPNPKNMEEITFNLKLNNVQNVYPIPKGIGKRKEKQEMIMDSTIPSRSTFDKDWGKQLDGEKQIIKIDKLDNLPFIKPDFVKIDVEGYEMDVLEGMKQIIEDKQPDLFIEIHGYLEDKMIEFLLKRDYHIHHVESGIPIDLSSPRIKGGHIYCFYRG